MKNKRFYSRINKTAKCFVYFNNTVRMTKETVANILNISEQGVCIELKDTKEIREDLDNNPMITIQLVDKYEYVSEEKTVITQEKCQIKWVQITDGTIHVGCRIPTPTAKWNDYIQDQKVIYFVRNKCSLFGLNDNRF